MKAQNLLEQIKYIINSVALAEALKIEISNMT